MVELDLQLSRDRQLVVFHDRSVGAPGGRAERISELTSAEIRRCRPTWAGDGVRRVYEVPTLLEVLAAAPPGLPLNLELKRYEEVDPAELVGALATTLPEGRPVLVSSFDAAVLLEARRRLPELPLAPLGGRAARWEELLELADRLRAFSIHVSRHLAVGLARDGLLERLVGGERPVLAYTVNRAAEARRLLAAGLAGLFTDRPGGLRRELEAG